MKPEITILCQWGSRELTTRLTALVAALALILSSGCQEAPVLMKEASVISPSPATNAGQTPESKHGSELFTLQDGDTVRVAFPGAPNLDTAQQIRPDGRVTLPLIGEVVASGKSLAILEAELVRLYTPHLVSKEINVTVLSSSIAVFVSGAVLRPGKVVADHPLTVLEAIMEAGGFDNAKANLAAVAVVRQSGGKSDHFTLNLKQVLDGKQVEPFYLKRSDIVYVPEKFQWF